MFYVDQMVTHGILKYCLRGFLGDCQREVVFKFFDACSKLFAEVQSFSNLSVLLDEVNLVLAT